MLLKCCIQYASKFRKLSSGHRTGKGVFIPVPNNGHEFEQTPGFLCGSDGKESVCNEAVPGLIPGSGRSSGEGHASVQFSSVAQSCLSLCDPMNHSTPGLPVHHKLPEFTQTHAHQVSDAIQPSHPLSSPSPPAPNPSQHQGLFQ